MAGKMGAGRGISWGGTGKDGVGGRETVTKGGGGNGPAMTGREPGGAVAVTVGGVGVSTRRKEEGLSKKGGERRSEGTSKEE